MERIAFLMILPLIIGAGPAKGARPSTAYKSVIQKAADLTLNQDREKATRTIVNALEAEAKPSKGYSELKKALVSMTEIFYTDKAQKIFELGRSLMATDTSGAIDKFNEALVLEPGNFKVLKEVTRSYLRKGECQKALDRTKEALLLNPFSTEFFLMRVQAKVCLGKLEDFDAEAANPYVEKDEVGVFLDLAKAQQMFQQEKWAAAEEALREAQRKDDQFPELYWWLAQIRLQLKKTPEMEIQEYVSRCKSLTAAEKSKYELEPRTCLELANAEKQLETLRLEGP